jgi:hypothetical protein
MKTSVVLWAGIAAAGIFLDGGEGWAGNKTKQEPGPKNGVQELYGLSWHRSLDSALKAAQKSLPNKPIFVLRTLGDLDGKT